jgi:hypothetical protein
MVANCFHAGVLLGLFFDSDDGGDMLKIWLWLPTAFMLVSCLAYSSALKMEEICSSEMSVDFQWTTRCYIPKDNTLHNHRCQNLKFYIEEIWKQVVAV